MKQKAEISATHDYYEFVCFDRMRWSTTKYDDLCSITRIVSFGFSAEDQLNEPLTDGAVLKALCTLLVFIESLNCSTIGV